MPRKASGKAKRPYTSALSIEQLWNMTKQEMMQLSEAEIKSTYTSLRKSVSSRLKTFEKAGLGSIVPKKVKSGMKPIAGRDAEGLVNELSEFMGWVRGGRSTVKGFRKIQEGAYKKMKESMPDLDLSTREKMNDFGYFMGEMQERYGEFWKYISNAARDIYRDLTAVNEDPRQFMRNYDFWKEKTEEVNKAKEAARAPGRRKSTKLSTYVNQLKRKKIR